MNRKLSLIILIVTAVFSACSVNVQPPSREIAKEFMKWNVDKQVHYFNKLGPSERMDLFAMLLVEQKDFSLGTFHCLRFYPDGEFAYDEISDEGYLCGKSENDKLRFLIGKWIYKNGEIQFFADPKEIPTLNNGYTWYGVHASNVNNVIVFEMDLHSSEESNKDGVFFDFNLGSPAIDAYSKLKEKQSLPQ